MSTRSALSHMFKQQLEPGKLEGTNLETLSLHWFRAFSCELNNFQTKRNQYYRPGKPGKLEKNLLTLPQRANITKNTYYCPGSSDFPRLLQTTIGSLTTKHDEIIVIQGLPSNKDEAMRSQYHQKKNK